MNQAIRNWYEALRSLAATMFRYAGVGGIVAILYMLLTTVFIKFAETRPLYASVGAFLLTVPVAYLGHKHLSFRSRGSHQREFARFVATMISAFIISTAVMLCLVERSGWHYGIGLLITSMLVPLANFIVLFFWVFRDDGS